MQMIYLIVILSVCYAVAQDADCDYIQNVGFNESFEINETFVAGQTCRFLGVCPAHYNCRLDCKINITKRASGCDSQFLLSRSGDPLLSGVEAYCGARALTAVSTNNTISLGVLIPESGGGGNIACVLSSTREPAVSKRGPEPCRCGERKQTKIVGGEETRKNEYTMMAGLIGNVDDSIQCGGTILSVRYVMTAAHCVSDYVWKPNALSVVVGIHNISEKIPTRNRHKIFRLIIHKKYDKVSYDYDISLVVTRRRLTLTRDVSLVCLPFHYRDINLAGSIVTILGWGTTSPGGVVSDVLRKVAVEVVEQDECRAAVGDVTDRQLCTFGRARDACQFDSGGPLLLEDPVSGSLVVVGVVSNGFLCGTERPAVNTRVSSLLTWIESNTWGIYC